MREVACWELKCSEHQGKVYESETGVGGQGKADIQLDGDNRAPLMLNTVVTLEQLLEVGAPVV